MVDPLLKNQFPEKDLEQAVAIAAMCLQEEEVVRPFMSDVVTTLSFLSVTPTENIPAPLSPPTTPLESNNCQDLHNQDSSHGTPDDEDSDILDDEGGINSDSEDEHPGSFVIEAKDSVSSSSHESERDSWRHKGSFGSHEGISVSSLSGHRSSEVTEKGIANGRKNSKRRSRKSGDNGSDFSSDNNSSRGSQNGNICVYLDHNNSRGSQDGSLYSS
jgi:hypothetical protein